MYECRFSNKSLGKITCVLFVSESNYLLEVLSGNRVDKQLKSALLEILPMAIDVCIEVEITHSEIKGNNVNVFLC